ncbi:MAG: protelomerase family protein [Cyanobacteria bacterium J06635_11]
MSPLSPLAEKALEQCSTQWLKTLLREFLPQIIDLPNTPAGHQQAGQWDALIKQRMAQRGLETPTQQKNPITDVRQVIKTIDAQHPALDEVGFTKEEWTEINMPSEQAVGRRTAKPIADPEEIARRAALLLNSDSWSEIAAGLAVVTGRRAAEVMQTAQFEQASPWSVWFTGALKRRGEEVELRFEIPTLVKATSVIAATKRLRRAVDTEGMSNREINRAYSHAIAQACDRTFTDLVPRREGKDNLYTHLFRSVYSTVATFWYCPPEVPELEFRAAIQGHYQILEEGQTELRRSLAASRHYFDYEIADKVIAAQKGKRKGVKLKRPGVEVISTFKPSEDVKPQEDIVMSRIGITEDDKQRVLAIQDEMNIGTQQDTMQAILNAADTAITLSDVLECQPVEVAERVEELRKALEQERRQNRELQAKLAEAEQMVGVAGGGTSTNKVIEQSLAMAHEFNTHLKGENERIRQELSVANNEVETLRSQLSRFEASQQQLTQLQQLLNGGLGGVPAAQAQPTVPVQPTARPTAQQQSVQPIVATQAQVAVAEKGSQTEESHADKTEREIANLIREIMQYNDQQAADDSERWLINQSTLKQLSTRSQTLIKRVLEGEMADELEAHHDKYGLYGRRANVGKNIETLKAALGIQK